MAMGFIQDELDLKLLVMYIISRAAAPITFLQLYVECFEYTWIVKCALTFLGMVPGSGFARYCCVTCAFLAGGGLVLAENEPGWNAEL